IDDFHHGEAQRRVRAAIADRYLGELPVGAALVVELPAPRFPFVVAAPTMRVPGSVAGSINAYLSLRAALVAVLLHAREHAEAGNSARAEFLRVQVEWERTDPEDPRWEQLRRRRQALEEAHKQEWASFAAGLGGRASVGFFDGLASWLWIEDATDEDLHCLNQ